MNKPGSIYATFLVCGARTALRATNVDGHSQEDDEDAHMQSSPFMSSSAPPQDDARVDALMSVITLVGDKDLEGKCHDFTLNSFVPVLCAERGTSCQVEV